MHISPFLPPHAQTQNPLSLSHMEEEAEDEFGPLYTDVISLPRQHPTNKPTFDLNVEAEENKQEEVLPSNLELLRETHENETRVIDGFVGSRLKLNLNEKRKVEGGDFARVLKEEEDDVVKFDVEEYSTELELDLEPLIHDGGFDQSKVLRDNNLWTDHESDSEDNLQILLNNNDDPQVPTLDRGATLVSWLAHQPMEDNGLGGYSAAVAYDEKMEINNAAESNGVSFAPQIGFNDHAHNQYCAPFQDVIPGAVARSPGAPLGTVQVFPPNLAIGAACAKSDSHQPAFEVPFQSNFKFASLSYRATFEVDASKMQEKPWKRSGIDVSMFFNYDLNEDSWNDYRKQLLKYCPNLPLDLGEAAVGLKNVPTENFNLRKTEAGQDAPMDSSANALPPFPKGFKIPVVTDFAERLPSYFMQQPRCDYEAIIEILLQGSEDDDFHQRYETDNEEEKNRQSLGSPHVYSEKNWGLIRKRARSESSFQDKLTDGDGALPSSQGAPFQSPKICDATPCKERLKRGEKCGKAHAVVDGGPMPNKSSLKRKENSFGNDEPSAKFMFPSTDHKHGDDLHNNLVLADRSSETNGAEIPFAAADNELDEHYFPYAKKQRLHSQVERSTFRNEEQGVRSKGYDVSHEIEMHLLLENKGNNFYSLEHHRVRTEATHKDSDKSYAEDRKRLGFVDEIASIHWDKVRENEKLTKDQHLHPSKQIKRGKSRDRHNKSLGSRHRERDYNMKRGKEKRNLKNENTSSDRDHRSNVTRWDNEKLKKRALGVIGCISRIRRNKENIHARGNQFGADKRCSRYERIDSHNNNHGGASDKKRAHEKHHNKSIRKSKNYEDHERKDFGSSRRHQEGYTSQINQLVTEKSSNEHKKYASADDKPQEPRRRRSKFERWTGYREFNVSPKPPTSSLKENEFSENNFGPY